MKVIIITERDTSFAKDMIQACKDRINNTPTMLDSTKSHFDEWGNMVVPKGAQKKLLKDGQRRFDIV